MSAAVFFRKCAACGRGMNEGYLADYQYFCSDACLHTVYSPAQWDQLYSDDSDEYYWTDWAEPGEADDPVYTADGQELQLMKIRVTDLSTEDLYIPSPVDAGQAYQHRRDITVLRR